MENSAENRIKYIEQMEDALNRCTEVLTKYEEALALFRDVQDTIRSLSTYYDSLQWRADFEDSEKGNLPPDLRCGVLTEDAVWNLLTENQELAIEMLETAAEILKKA